MKTPLISIITVVYNGAELLQKTIESVVIQDYKSLEYIIVDGNSTDGTIDIIKKYESKIAVWKSEPDSGIYNAMNKGAKMASGEWVCFLNCGDVFIDNQVVSKVAEWLTTDILLDIVYGNILVETAKGGYREKIAREPCNLQRMYFCHQSAFVRLSLLQQYPFDEQHKMSADFKFFKQCFYENRKFKHLNFPIVLYDKTGISHTSRINGLKENIIVIKNLDKGWTKYKFLLKLYFVIYWRKFLGK